MDAVIRQEAPSGVTEVDEVELDVVHLGAEFGELAIQILTTRSTVAVVGLGYVGLPLLMTAARNEASMPDTTLGVFTRFQVGFPGSIRSGE